MLSLNEYPTFFDVSTTYFKQDLFLKRCDNFSTEHFHLHSHLHLLAFEIFLFNKTFFLVFQIYYNWQVIFKHEGYYWDTIFDKYFL